MKGFSVGPVIKAAVLLMLLSGGLAYVYSQGPLTPPGAPAPTMKTLDQIEARTPISTAPFTISTPGSYYVTQSLTVNGGDGITIAASGVTLDLNGFSLSSTAGSATGTAIRLVRPISNVTISNGNISGGATYDGTTFSGSGFANGIDVNSAILPPATNVRVSGVSVSSVTGNGINGVTSIDHCLTDLTGGLGMSATLVDNSLANNCGNTCITATNVANSRAFALRNVTAVSSFVASNCTAGSETGIAFSIRQSINCYGIGGAASVPKSHLLIPFVTNQAGFDTSIAISNTGEDASGVTASRTGKATFYFHGPGAPSSSLSSNIAPGGSYTTLLSLLAPGFQGYIDVVCDFPLAHGFAFVSDVGTRNLATTVPVLVLPAQNTAARSNSNAEILGQ